MPLQVVKSRKLIMSSSGDYAEEVLGCGHVIQTCNKPEPCRDCKDCKEEVNIDWWKKLADPYHKGYQDALSGIDPPDFTIEQLSEEWAKKYNDGYRVGLRHLINGRRLKGYK